MTLIVTSRTRKRRQPYVAIANPNSPLLVGASGLWSFRGPDVRNLLNDEAIVLSGGGIQDKSARGAVGRLFASGTSPGTSLVQLAADSSTILPTSGGITFALHYRKTDATNRVSGAFGLNIASDVTRRFGAHLPYNDGIAYFDVGNQDAASRITVAGLVYGDDFWVFTTGPRGMEIWQNGVRRAANGNNPSRTSTTAPFYLGNHANVGSDNAESQMGCMVQRQWAVDEILEFFSNPWQLYLRKKNARHFNFSGVAPSFNPAWAGPATHMAMAA